MEEFRFLILFILVFLVFTNLVFAQSTSGRFTITGESVQDTNVSENQTDLDIKSEQQNSFFDFIKDFFKKIFSVFG